MIEEWLMAGAGNEAGRSRLRHLLDVPPAPDPWKPVTAGSTSKRRRGSGLSLAEAERIVRDAEEWDRSMDAG